MSQPAQAALPSDSAPANRKKFHGPAKPRKPKLAVLSPEAKRLARERDLAMIDDFLKTKGATMCATKWAPGCLHSVTLGDV